jgi:hypothetical protein
MCLETVLRMVSAAVFACLLLSAAMLLWPRLVVGVLWYHKPHLGRVFPSHLGTGDWRPGCPPGFSI